MLPPCPLACLAKCVSVQGLCLTYLTAFTSPSPSLEGCLSMAGCLNSEGFGLTLAGTGGHQLCSLEGGLGGGVLNSHAVSAAAPPSAKTSVTVLAYPLLWLKTSQPVLELASSQSCT
jgi:hypothetical protein